MSEAKTTVVENTSKKIKAIQAISALALLIGLGIAAAGAIELDAGLPPAGWAKPLCWIGGIISVIALGGVLYGSFCKWWNHA